MKKKIKKMIKNPTLFFNDMWRKRVIGIQKTLPQKYICKNSYNLVIVGNENTKNIEGCLRSIYAQRIDFSNLNIILLDLGLNDSHHKILKEFRVNVISAKETQLNNFNEALSGKYTAFIWADDFIDVNFILNTEKFISINRNKDFGLIFTNPQKGLVYNKVTKEYHPLRMLYKKVPHSGVPSDQLVLDSIYGSFILTARVRA